MINIIDNWQDYYDLLQRTGKRALYAIKAQIEEVSDEDIQDSLYYYFIICWHFKDWIISSGFLEKGIVNDFANRETGTLRIIGDVADSMKHFHLDSRIRIPTQLRMGQTEFVFVDRKTKKASPFRFILVVANGGERVITASDLIKRSLAEWEAFINENKEYLKNEAKFSDTVFPDLHNK